MNRNETNSRFSEWLKVLRGPIILLCIAALIWTLYGTYRSYKRRASTVARLVEERNMWREADVGYGQAIADAIENTADMLSGGQLSVPDQPYVYIAYISSPPAVYPNDAPILALHWLEDRYDVDGFDLYVDDTLVATVTGWKHQSEIEHVVLKELFEDRYDRFIYVDVPTSPTQNADNNRDVVPLTEEQIRGKLEVQLRLNTPCGARLHVLVDEKLVEEVEPL